MKKCPSDLGLMNVWREGGREVAISIFLPKCPSPHILKRLASIKPGQSHVETSFNVPATLMHHQRRATSGHLS